MELVRLLSGVLCIAFFAAVAAVIWQTPWRSAPASVIHDTASIATILFSRYVLPFEIAGLSLTIALIGSIVIAREDDVLAVIREGGAPIEVGAPLLQGDRDEESVATATRPAASEPVAQASEAPTGSGDDPDSGHHDEWDGHEEGES